MSLKEVRNRPVFNSRAKKIKFWYDEFMYIITINYKNKTTPQISRSMRRSKVGNLKSRAELDRAVCETRNRLEIIPEYLLKNMLTFTKEEQRLIILTSIMRLDNFFKHFVETFFKNILLSGKTTFTVRMVLEYLNSIQEERLKIGHLSDITKRELRYSFLRYMQYSFVIVPFGVLKYKVSDNVFSEGFKQLLKEQKFYDMMEVLDKRSS